MEGDRGGSGRGEGEGLGNDTTGAQAEDGGIPSRGSGLGRVEGSGDDKEEGGREGLEGSGV